MRRLMGFGATVAVVLAIAALMLPTVASAHHNGNNPFNGNINEERVHSGMPTDVGQRSMNGQVDEPLTRVCNQDNEGSGNMNENRNNNGRAGDSGEGIWQSMFGFLKRLWDTNP